MRRFLNQWTKTFFPTFRKHFEALNATICWSVLCKFLTIEKYGVSAFTGKKINVIRPKLIENERNEVLNFFTFSKKNPFFSNFENPLKKTAPRAVFFWKDDSISKRFKIISNHFLRFLKASLESWDFTLSDSETLNAMILLYAKSSHLEAKRSQF